MVARGAVGRTGTTVTGGGGVSVATDFEIARFLLGDQLGLRPPVPGGFRIADDTASRLAPWSVPGVDVAPADSLKPRLGNGVLRRCAPQPTFHRRDRSGGALVPQSGFTDAPPSVLPVRHSAVLISKTETERHRHEAHTHHHQPRGPADPDR